MSNMLTLHGTPAIRLTPSSVVGAALADLKRRAANTGGPPYEPYAFHRRHVKQARSAADLIRRAAEDLERGRKSGKKSTLLIYERDLLEAALAAAPPPMTVH